MADLLNEQKFFIDLILNTNNYLEFNYNKEYKSKGELQKLEKMNISQFDIMILDDYLTKKNIKEKLVNEIMNIKTECLYKSPNHGISHNIKVLTYALIMCEEQKLSNEITKIILDSCKYHDIGRINDLEDMYHGERSSNKLDEVIADDKFYQNLTYKNLLKAAIEIHSKDDKLENSIALKYNVNLEQLKPIYSILKDADALDRIRLTITFPIITDLNTKYLRTKESKQLVKFASQLNTLYYQIYIKKINLKYSNRRFTM